MPRTLRRTLALASGLAVLAVSVARPMPALAGNKTGLSIFDVTANFNTIQFKLNYTGDDNQNSSVSVKYWKTNSPTAIDTAVVPIRDVSRPAFTGVVFWLDENLSYTVSATITDTDGFEDVLGTSATYTRAITTRSSAMPPVTGNMIWVSPSGNNNYDGSSATLAKQTIAAALASLSGPGSQIRLLPGTYYETFQPTNVGDSGHYYSIVGNGNPDSIIIEGSAPALLADTNWTYSGSDSVYYRIYPQAYFNVTLITAGSDQRLHHKNNLPELMDPPADQPVQGFRTGHNLPNSNLDTIFVRLENGASPNASAMHVGVRPTIAIHGAFWRVESLTTRFSNGPGISFGDYAVRDLHSPSGWHPGVVAGGSIVRHCRSYDNFKAGVNVHAYSDSVLIDGCSIWDTRISRWTYLAVKNRDEEASVGILSQGHNTVVRNCSVTGVSNGIQVIGVITADPTLADSTWGADSDVYYNKVTDINDDALEFDFNQGVNVAAWGNFIRGANNGWSQTTSDIGPMYVLYNVFDTMIEGGIKLGVTPGSGDSASIFYYHNTFTSSSPFLSVGGSGPFKNQTFANNILVGKGAGPPKYRYIVATDSGLVTKAKFDYDLNWHTDSPSGTDIWWVGDPGNPKTWDFQEIRDRWGFEIHGNYGAPTYMDSAGGNFLPASADAPQVDMGTRIQGINTPYKTRNNVYLYSGKPDVGAYESGMQTSPPTWPPLPSRLGPAPIDPRIEGGPAEVGFALGAPHPNPLLGGTSFQVTLAKRTEVEAGVYDVSGRLVRVIAARRVFPAGKKELTWDGRDQRGMAAPTGMYFLRVQARTDQAVRRVMVLR